MNATKPGSAGSGTALRRADHAGSAYDRDIGESRSTLADCGALNYVAHFTSGILDFAVEATGSGAPPAGTQACDRAGRQLSLAVAQLDNTCDQLDTGPLIRLVLQGENGALFHMLKVPGQSFVGLALDGDPVRIDQADQALARLARSAVHRVGAASLQWGGFFDREHAGEQWRPDEALPPPVPRAAGPAAPAQQVVAIPESVTDACQDALHRNDLHYVGVYRRSQRVWHADIFDDQGLAPFFQRITPSSRRRGYDQVIRQVDLQSRRFRQLLAIVNSDRIARVVLDVARGAIFVVPVGDEEYLTGVTLIQSRVKQADRKIRELQKKLRQGTSTS